jgi:hypothetical protein
VYPPFGTTKMDGHGFCGRGTEVYGQDLLAFLNDALK